jgi:hypothetical protein
MRRTADTLALGLTTNWVSVSGTDEVVVID